MMKPEGERIWAIWYGVFIAMTWTAAIVLLLCSGCPAGAQWGGNSCGPVGPNAFVWQPEFQPRQVEYPRFVWKEVPGDDSQAALFEYGKQIGNYSFASGKFRQVATGDVWSAAALPAGVAAPRPAASRIVRQKRSQTLERACAQSCGCSCCGETCECGKSKPICSSACRCVVVGKAAPLTGVCTDKIQHGQTTINGREVSVRQAVQALLGDSKSLVDDSELNHLTLIGTPTECQPVLDDLASNPALAAAKGKLVVQSYTPEQGRVRDAGFKCDGHPSIYLQAPNGKVLHRQDGYRGADKLAEAIRKADPHYDPSKDPDLNKQPAPKPQPRTPDNPASQAPWYFWAGLAGLAVLILKK